MISLASVTDYILCVVLCCAVLCCVCAVSLEIIRRTAVSVAAARKKEF